MLLGRADEVGRIDGLLRAAEDGLSAALIIHGEPGIGKTSLLEHVAAGAESRFVVLRVRPLEVEADLPFAGLSDLVRPLQHHVAGLPERQRAALSGALALGPPAPDDRFGVAAATLNLLATAAQDAPVLAVIDDAHWLDAPSREALLFAARRIAGEGVVLLFATRDHEWLSGVGVQTLELQGLHPDDTEALLAGTGLAVDDDVRRQLVAGTRGNPLALLEATGNLSAAQLGGTVALAAPLAVGAALEQAFARDLDGLPADTRRALLVAAASRTGVTGEIVNALAAIGLDRSALEPAERMGLVTVTDRVGFRHPLIRSAAYHRSDSVEQRAAHRAFAGTLGAGERSAWHLAEASVGPDEQAASELEAFGSTALARSAYAAAGSAFEAAAGLSPDDGDRLRRTLVAGRALWLGGESQRAADLLQAVLELATEPTVRADLQQLRSATVMFTRPVSETQAMLVAEAERVQPHDHARAAAMFATASLACILLGDLGRARECARRADAVADRDSAVATFVAPAMLAIVAASLGDVGQARGRLIALLERVQPAQLIGEFSTIVTAVAWTLTWIEEWTLAREVIERSIGAARAAGAPSVLPLPLGMLAELEFRCGRLAAAYAAATESVQLAADTGQSIASAHSLVMLARTEAVLGHEEHCRAHVAAALTLTARTGAHAFDSYGALTLGLLELSHGRPERVAAQRAGSARLDDPSTLVLTSSIQASADVVEAHVRSGARAEAARGLAFLELHAERFGLRWPRAAAARCRGLLVAEPFEAEFATALELFGDDMPFDRARTQLALGMRRRRARRRAEARTMLRAALDYFEAAGADPWAEQARAELRASGATPVHHADGSLRSLTPQELQVALTVAGGATNREAAASLFLSEKTVEFHLSNAYRKLGLRSRSELIRRVEGLH